MYTALLARDARHIDSVSRRKNFKDIKKNRRDESSCMYIYTYIYKLTNRKK